MSMTLTMIEITSFCNLACPYCVRTTDRPVNRHITPEEFDHILKELLTIPSYRFKRVALCGYGEPLMNPLFMSMLHNPLLKQFPNVDMTTNGMLLTRDMIESIIDAQTLKRVRVSLQSSRKEVMESLQKGAKFEKVVENTKNLIHYARNMRTSTEIRIQCLKTTLNPDETKAEFEKLLGIKFGQKVSFRLKITTPVSGGNKMSKDVHDIIPKDKKGNFLRKDITCNNEYARNVIINSQGFLQGCCWDCTMQQTYGNIFKTPLKQLRSSELLKSLRKELVERDFHSLPICKRCLTTPEGIREIKTPSMLDKLIWHKRRILGEPQID